MTKGPDGKSGREKTRDERLAEALRANLRKRKSAPRREAQAGGSEVSRAGRKAVAPREAAAPKPLDLCNATWD